MKLRLKHAKKNMCDANFIIFQTRKDQKNENNVNYT